jgi:hypothetical protein
VNTNEFWIDTYGAKADNKTDDAASIMAAIEAAGPTGGTVKLLPSVSLCGSPLVIPPTFTSIKIEGSSKATSGLNFPSSAGVVFAPSAWGMIEARNFSMTGSGILFTLGNAAIGPEQSTIEKMLFANGSLALDVYNAGTLRIQQNDFINFSNAAIQLSAPANPDGGDNWIADNFLLNSGSLVGTGVGIHHISGGGYKISRNKFNQHIYSIYVNPTMSAAQETSALQIHDNSIEGYKLAGILFQDLFSTGNIYNVKISDNEMSGIVGSYAIEIQSNPGVWITNLGMTGNIIRGVNAFGGIYIDGVDTFNASGNVITDAGTGGVGITVGGRASRGIVGANAITNFTTQVSNGSSSVEVVS